MDGPESFPWKVVGGVSVLVVSLLALGIVWFSRTSGDTSTAEVDEPQDQFTPESTFDSETPEDEEPSDEASSATTLPSGVDIPFQIATIDWEDGGEIPTSFTCDGDDVAPRFNWTAVAEETQEYVMIAEDLDAEGFTHWTAYGLAVTSRQFRDTDLLEGVNDFGQTGYNGPCPPAGQTHRYRFTLFALDRPSELEAGASASEVRSAVDGAALEVATYEGTYTRPG